MTTLSTASFFICFSVLICAPFAHTSQAETVRIGLASDSPIKITAVQNAFRSLYKHSSLEFKTYPAESGIPPQPVGKESGTLGAINRLTNAKTHIQGSGEFNYWVSIENYIEEPSPNAASWIDQAVVLVESPGALPVMEYSEPVYFESSYAKEAQRTSETFDLGYMTTVGTLISKAFYRQGINLPHNDWHQHPQFGGKSRALLLEEAVARAVIKSEIKLSKTFKKDVDFRDMMPLLKNPELNAFIVETVAANYRDKGIDAVAGLESRGFIHGSVVAYVLGVPFIAIRKEGGLPFPIRKQCYQKEYSQGKDDCIETDYDASGRTLLLIDDLLATGGTLRAAEKLMAGARKIYSFTLMEIEALKGRDTLSSEFHSYLKY